MHLFCWVFYLTQRHVWNVQIEHKLVILYDSEQLVYNIGFTFYSVHSNSFSSILYSHPFSRRSVISWNKNTRKLHISAAFVQMSNEKCPSKQRHRSNITLNAFNSTKYVFEGRVSQTKIEYIDHICLTITWGNALCRIIFYLWLL